MARDVVAIDPRARILDLGDHRRDDGVGEEAIEMDELVLRPVRRANGCDVQSGERA